MKKILYIEDDSDKAKNVESFIVNNIEGFEIIHRKSYTSGVIAIKEDKFDFILLDMSLPLYDKDDALNEENDFETFAGMDILDEMSRIGCHSKVIIITAFDILGENENQVNLKQLDERMIYEFSDIYTGIIHYNNSSLEWEKALKSIFIKERKTHENFID